MAGWERRDQSAAFLSLTFAVAAAVAFACRDFAEPAEEESLEASDAFLEGMEEDPLELSPSLREIAHRVFGETAESRCAALVELRRRIEELPDPEDRLEDTSDENLIRFIRMRKYRLDKALKTTIAMQRFNAANRELVQFDPEEHVLKFSKFCQVMGDCDEKGRLVVTLHPIYSVSIFTDEYLEQHPNALGKFTVWLLDRLSRHARAQVCGVVVINSFHDVGFWDAWKLSQVVTFRHLSRMMTYLHKCVGLRLGAALVFEEPLFISLIFPLLKPFMSAKTRDRFRLCGSDYHKIEEVTGDISILPESLGGKIPDSSCTGWIAEQLREQQKKSEIEVQEDCS